MNTTALTAQDRCDGCGAQAIKRVELKSGDELLFCNHHYNKSSDNLEKAEARVVFDSDAKVAEPALV